MTEIAKKKLEEAPTIGYWSEFGGVEVKEIKEDHWDMVTYVLCISGTFAGPRQYHKVRIHYQNDDWYIIINRHRFHGNDCIRSTTFWGKAK